MKLTDIDLTSMRSAIVVAAVLCIAPLASMAAPAVSGTSGTVAQGSTLTISGSGFGSRSTYNSSGDTWSGGRFMNFRFKDFEDSQINSDGFYAQGGGSPWTNYGSQLTIQSGGPANSKKFMRRIYGQENGGLSTDVSGAGNQLYTSFKFYVAPGTQSGKFWRFYADKPMDNVYISTGCQDFLVRGASECTAGSCASKQTEWGTGPALTPGSWHRVEFWVNSNDNTVTNYVDGVKTWTRGNWLDTSGLKMNGHTIDYPNMIDGARNPSCPPNGSYNYDDIYIDFTAARVEIADSPTWSAARKKEVQIPVSWSANSIEVRVNAGTFSAGDRAYLFVLDSSGTPAAAGFPVTIGGSSTTPPAVIPNPPSDVEVN